MASKKSNEAVGEVSILSSGVKVEGRIYSDGNLRLDGSLNGEIVVNGNLTIGESAEIIGEIKAQNVTLSGKVEGTLLAHEKVILEPGAFLKGELTAKVLVIEEGALFDGKSQMLKEKIEANEEQNP